MAKREKKWVKVMNESGILLYEDQKVKVWKEPNGKLFFESNDPILCDTFMSDDYAESVAALMRLPKVFNDDKLWNIKINKDKYDITTSKVLYWLTGGNKEWNDKNHYKNDWNEIDSIFTHQFEDTIFEIVGQSNTLGDIKRGFMRHLNLPIIYEFALNNDLID
ncbi:MAG: hypothetical protein SLAVMIC_00289 [uncultured marine phage]|uniref:Uncharacterized protein n=1 Tax=uncultured marine phage TaxID=707152 RepID=A0A8D9C9R6_9VIRU|nr:MAG: hypothetical protein SLAVMIC_00289 [uncultured marine phage]